MCRERNILRGWHRIKNAHSSYRLLEMESYQTRLRPPPPIIATQTFTEEEKQERETQTDRQRWTGPCCNNTYTLTSGETVWPQITKGKCLWRLPTLLIHCVAALPCLLCSLCAHGIGVSISLCTINLNLQS